MAENSEGTANKRGRGRPFEPGTSGNPGGRPRVIVEVRDLARQHGPEIVRALVAIARKGRSESARVAACREILDRAYGRTSPTDEGNGLPPYEALMVHLREVASREGGTVTLSDEALQAIAAGDFTEPEKPDLSFLTVEELRTLEEVLARGAERKRLGLPPPE